MSTPINSVEISKDNNDNDIVQGILDQLDKETQEVEQDYNEQQEHYSDQQFGMEPQRDMQHSVPHQARQMMQNQYQNQENEYYNNQNQMQMPMQMQNQYHMENMTLVQKITHVLMTYSKSVIISSIIVFLMCIPVVGKSIVRYIPKFSNQYGGLNTWGLLLRALLSGILITSANYLV